MSALLDVLGGVAGFVMAVFLCGFWVASAISHYRGRR